MILLQKIPTFVHDMKKYATCTIDTLNVHVRYKLLLTLVDTFI